MLLVQVGLAVGGALSETFKDISGLADVGIQLMFLKFSRHDERQADTCGVNYSRSARYNPEHMIGFFNALEMSGSDMASFRLRLIRKRLLFLWIRRAG